MIYQYEHFAPEFVDAKEHNADGICLLCGSCHQDVTAKRISKEQVRSAYAYVRDSNNVKPPFYVAKLSNNLRLGLGASEFRYLHKGSVIFSSDGDEKLSLRYVEDSVFGGYRPSISGTINDFEGNPVVDLDDNCITARVETFDITLEGNKLSFRRGPRDKDICLQFSFSEGGSVTISRARTTFGDVTIELDDAFGVTVPHLAGGRVTFLIEAKFDAPSEIISYVSDRSLWGGDDLEINFGGINLPGTGCCLAKNCPSMVIKSISLRGELPSEAGI